jgi:hypothetical protein
MTEGRAEYGKLFVDLLLDVTVLASYIDDNIQDNDFALLHEGKVVRPEFVNEIVDQGTTRRIPVVFVIDDSVTSFTLRFDVSHDSDATPETEWASQQVLL